MALWFSKECWYNFAYTASSTNFKNKNIPNAQLDTCRSQQLQQEIQANKTRLRQS